MNTQLSLFQRKAIDFHPDPRGIGLLHVSGGKDSLAMLLYCLESYHGLQFQAIYKDTGFEHPGVFEYLQGICEAVGVPLVRTIPPKGLFELAKTYGRLPRYNCRYCTSALKRQTSDKFIRHAYPADALIYNFFGLRAEESRERARRGPVCVDQFLSTRTRHAYMISPIFYWSVNDVVEFVEGHGFRLFHTYGYLSRLSCRYCFLAGRRDHEAVRLHDPEGFKMVQNLKETLKIL